MEGKTVAIIGGVTVTAIATSLGLWYFLTQQGSSVGQPTTGATTGPGASPGPTTATYKVQVLDNSTKKPIPGVSCTCDGYDAVTDATGVVSFVLPLGNYRFKAEHSNYVYTSDLWFNVTEVDLGQTFGPQIVELEPNKPILQVPSGFEATSLGSNPAVKYPGCGCCTWDTKAKIVLEVVNKKGNPLQYQTVHIKRISGPHEIGGDSGKIEGNYITDGSGRISVVVGPSGRCKCGGALSGLVTWTDWRCERTQSQWQATVPKHGLSQNVVVTYTAPSSTGDALLDAIV